MLERFLRLIIQKSGNAWKQIILKFFIKINEILKNHAMNVCNFRNLMKFSRYNPWYLINLQIFSLILNLHSSIKSLDMYVLKCLAKNCDKSILTWKKRIFIEMRLQRRSKNHQIWLFKGWINVFCLKYRLMVFYGWETK